MSWRKLSESNSRLIKRAGAALLAGSLGLGASGCGFHPLYATAEYGGSNVGEAMKTIQIATIPSRTGQRLRNELIFGASGGAGEPASPVYRLDVALRESVRNTLVLTNGAPTGQVIELDAEFRLVRIKSNETVFKGYSSSQASYDLYGVTGTTGSSYGDTRAAIDAENRAARSLADTLKTRVAAYLSHAST